MIAEHDDRQGYCPMLGHAVSFLYCRSPAQEIPCRKIFDCWWESFDIRSFMEENYPPEILSRIVQPTKPKIQSLLELIEQAKKRST